MRNKILKFITESDLINIQIQISRNTGKYWKNVLQLKKSNVLNKKFLNKINRTISSYFLSFDKREANLRKKIEKKTEELLELINSDYIESLKMQRNAVRKIISNMDKGVKTSYEDSLRACHIPFSPHNAKLEIIDQSLKESKISSYHGTPVSLSSIRQSLSILLNELDKLNPRTFDNKKVKLKPSAYIEKFNKLEQKQTGVDIDFIRDLHKVYRAYTGKSDKLTL